MVGLAVVRSGPAATGCGAAVAGHDTPHTGSLTWYHNTPPGPGDMGFFFPDATLLPWANAEANVFLPLRLAGQSLETARPIVRATLAQLGLAGFDHAKPTELSGGMRMRVSIARAMIGRPRLLLMDEPFAALDEFTRHRLQNDLRTLWRETGMTVVFVTHSIYEAAFLASQVVIMTPRPGQIATIHPGIEQTTESRRTDPAMVALVGAISADVARMMPIS
jgi:NitT/TauT family transport system ATP-binding protein